MEIAANVSAGFSIGDVEKVVNDAVSPLHHKPRPLYIRRSASAIGTGAVVTLDLGAPPNGSIWQVRVATLFGSDDHTTISNLTGALYTGDAANPSLASLHVTGLAFPSTTTFPDTAMWCHPNENLILVTSGTVDAAQQVGINVTVEEWKEHEVSRNSGR
jgi:hypothetical protein